MDQFYIYTEQSPWLIPVCLAGGALYAYALYSRTSPWPANINKLLAGLRFVLASVLLFLLLGPFIRYISNNERKPIVAVALDNSESVKLFSDSVRLKNTVAGVQQLQSALQGHDMEVVFHTLNGRSQNLHDVDFNEQATNIDAQLNTLRTDYENRNLSAVVLLSDGIYNRGRSPLFSVVPFPVYTVGLGDTAVKRDVIVSSLNYNKVSYSGNNLPIEAELQQNGFGSRTVTVTLSDGNKTLERKEVTLPAGGAITKVQFTTTAGSPGKKHFVVTSQPVNGEFTELNNTRHAYIDVIEGKLKVLIAAAAPHPDIKAIKQALEIEENIEVEVYLPGINQLRSNNYDLAILHQLPTFHRVGADALELVKSKKIPALYIIGMQSDIPGFNQLNSGVTINRKGASQTDQVLPTFNQSFGKFNFSPELQQQLKNYPPVEVPFADFTLAPGMDVILKQQVGSLATDKPLLAAKSGAAGKTGVLIGDGIWEWRLREFSESESAESFDKLFQNIVQLLTVKETKKRLNVYPVKDEFSETEAVQFQAEVYNNVYQQIYDQQINLTITGEDNQKREFSFVNGQGNARFTAGNFTEGIYRYTATTRLDGKTETDRGEFIVQANQLEALTSQADHNLLYQLATQTGGSFFLPEQLTNLQELLLNQNFKPVLYPSERLLDIINLKWIFFLLLALLSLEWFLRKYFGGY